MIKNILLTTLILLSGCEKNTVTPIDKNDIIVAVGDSLTFGYGGSGVNYPQQLGIIIKRQVINEGVNGDTSAKVLVRIDDILKKQMPSYILLSIGGNDMLNRISDQEIKSNILAIIDKIHNNNVKVILISEPRPKTIGIIIGLDDAKFYKEISSEKNVLLISDVFSKNLNDENLKSDLIHLNNKGYIKTAEKIAEFLKNNKLIIEE